MKRNRYSKALNHLKSTELDEKIQRLNEAPINNTSGIYALNEPGFRLGGLDDQDPERVFYADVDGNWPAGIPGKDGELTYTRPKGFWDSGPGTAPAVQTTETRDFLTVSGVNGSNTDNFIRSSDGFVIADLPPNTRNFILGPLVDAYALNHGAYYNDDYTNIGYIQKDTRQFVLLGRIPGTWSKAQSITIGNFTSTVWDGATGFISYNANFTLEHALWFRQKMLSGKYTAAVPYKYSGGIPQPPDPNNPGFYNGNVPDDGKAGGSGDNQGNPQDAPVNGGPDPNLPPGSANPNLAMDNLGGFMAAAAALGFVFKSIETFINWFNKQSPEMQQKLKDLAQPQISGGPTLYGPNGPSLKPDGTSGFSKPGEMIKGNNGQWYEYVPGSGWMGIPSLKLAGGASKPQEISQYTDDPSTWPSIKNPVKLPPPIIDPKTGWPSVPNVPPSYKGKPGGSSVKLAHYEPQGQVLTENRQRILREIKKPVKVSEPPVQKLKKYRPNFAGKYTAQNTPDVTASPLSDEMVKAKNAAGQTWRTKDKHWARYESTERMNIIYDNVGHASQYWDRIVNENQMKKVMRDREIQEQLNIIAHEKAMLREDPLYESPFKKTIQEQETLQADKDPLFKKVKNKLKSQIDYPDKPAKLGYPNNPTPETINGWHPEYGQKDAYYNKLDPQSADSMPDTGNLEIDAKVRRAKTLKKVLGKKA